MRYWNWYRNPQKYTVSCLVFKTDDLPWLTDWLCSLFSVTLFLCSHVFVFTTLKELWLGMVQNLKVRLHKEIKLLRLKELSDWFNLINVYNSPVWILLKVFKNTQAGTSSYTNGRVFAQRNSAVELLSISRCFCIKSDFISREAGKEKEKGVLGCYHSLHLFCIV